MREESYVLVVAVVVVFRRRSLPSASNCNLSQRPIPISLHTVQPSTNPVHRTQTISISSFYTSTSFPKSTSSNNPKAMSNSKPYVSSSGTVGAQPLTHKISIKLSDFATLAYLFFETLVSVSHDKWQIHIFYLSCVHIMIGRKRIKR